MNWAKIIREYRMMRGIKQAALAEILGVDQATVSRWETGRQEPELRTQVLLRDMIYQEPHSESFKALQAFVENATTRMALITGFDLFFIGQSKLFMQTGRAIFPKDKPFASAARIEDDHFVIEKARAIVRDKSVFRFEYGAKTFTPDGKLAFKTGHGSRMSMDGVTFLIIEETLQTREDYIRSGGTRLEIFRLDDIPKK